MKNLRKLVAAVVLTCFLGLSAIAGETSAPPCPPPEPGETSAPPCTGGQMAGDNSGLVSTPPASVSSPPASDSGYLVAEAAINLFESLLLY